MKKRSIILTVMLLLASLLSAAALDVQAEGLPTSVHLTWNGIEGAEHYDIYNGDVPVARLDRDAREYTVTHLLSDTEYRLCIAARSPEDKDLAAEWVSESTTSWDGGQVRRQAAGEPSQPSRPSGGSGPSSGRRPTS